MMGSGGMIPIAVHVVDRRSFRLIENICCKTIAGGLQLQGRIVGYKEHFMRPLPSCKLNPKVKNVWRISAAVLLILFALGCALPFLIVAAVEASWGLLVAGAIAAVTVVLAVWFVGIFPQIRFARWRYEVGEHELDIMRGIFWRKRFVIPFIRVQNTDTKQGPIMRAFGLAQVTVATAAGEHQIPGLTVQEADALRDVIATQARLARGDI